MCPTFPGWSSWSSSIPERWSTRKTLGGGSTIGVWCVGNWRPVLTAQNVVVVGSSVSGMDAALDLIGHAKTPVVSSSRGSKHPYFGDSALGHPKILRRPEISHISPRDRTVHFSDGSTASSVDRILFGTGYRYSFPFLEDVRLEGNRVNGQYLHVVNVEDPTLTFVGMIAAGLTFKAFEWQAVLVSRLYAGRAELPPVAEQRQWEADRVKARGNGAKYTALFPDFEGYFETVRRLAGDQGPGRKLPKFDPAWVQAFNAGHQRRIDRWRVAIEKERQKASA